MFVEVTPVKLLQIACLVQYAILASYYSKFDTTLLNSVYENLITFIWLFFSAQSSTCTWELVIKESIICYITSILIERRRIIQFARFITLFINLVLFLWPTTDLIMDMFIKIMGSNYIREAISQFWSLAIFLILD